MKKSVLRLGKILSAIVLATVVMFTGTNTVNGAANSIKVGTVTTLPGYVAGVKFHIKPLVGGGYAYCLNIHKETASNVTEYLKGEMDAGVAYILENGYPKKNFTGNKKKDFYITQGALWWYLDDTTGTANLGNGFKKTGSDSYGLRKYMKKLVSGAKSAKKAGYANPSMSASVSTTKMNLDSSESKYTSSKITVKTKNISKYKAELANGPKGAYVADVNGNKKTSFNAGDKFIVVVPASSINAGKTETAKVNVTATSTIYKAYKYAPKNSSIQPMTILQPVSKTVKSSVTVKASKPEAPKCKYDATKNIYYGIDGRVVTKEVYEDECLPKRYCEYDKDQDKYYGKNGKVVTKEQYIIECSENSVTIYKVDKNTNNTIAGAVLVIKDANGNAIKEFTSTINGYNITGLANGKYTVEEKIAPKGYELSKNIETFTLSDTSKSVKVYFYNIPKSRTVIINKVDSTTGKAVAGAVIVIKDANDKEVARFTSTTEAYIMNNIAEGTYTVEEVQAPEGYLLSNEIQTFTIDEDHNSYQITIKNVPKTCENTPEECEVEVPNTGSSSLPFYLIGIAIMTLGLGYVYKANKA